MKKAQSAIEFVVLATFMFLFFSVLFIYVQSLLVDITQSNKETGIEAVQAAVVKEIDLASRMPSGYERTFTLPSTIQGIPYSIQLQTETAPVKDAVLVSSGDTSLVAFLNADVSGTLQPGQNTLKKTATIQLN